MESIIKLIGHLHPLWVHFPIGILLFSILIHGLSSWEKYKKLEAALPFTYLMGALSAVFSCITGYALSNNGDYDANLIFKHQWLAISVAVISLLGYVFIKTHKAVYLKWTAFVLLILIFLTGHYGGTLTHGEGYLTKGVFVEDKLVIKNKPLIPNVQEAVLFNDIIQPILEEKCYGCHSSIKKKGKLRLDAQEWILKGGEDGLVLHAGDPLKSPLYKNILLDPVDEKHMPPKGKPQVTEQERRLLEWWISSGASFNKKVKELSPPSNMQSVLLAVQNNNGPKIQIQAIPSAEIGPADQKVINGLKKMGVTIVNVALNSNYISANFITVPHANDTINDLIKQINDNVVWIKMPGMVFNDPLVNVLADCKSLTKLSIENTNISDKQLAILNDLQELQYLNIVNTKISLNGLMQLNNLKKLNQLYVGQTNIKETDLARIKTVFPNATVNFGNYNVEKLITDTQILKVPQKK